MRIFDFGCGIGQGITPVPGACGWKLSRESREISRARGVTIFENLTDVPAEAFDLVFSRHTLEHVPVALRYVEDARRFAGQDGLLGLVLPGRERAAVTTDVDSVNLLHVAGWRAEHVAYTPYGGYTRMLPVYRVLNATAYRIACQSAARLLGTVELRVTGRKR